jgi:hypothetical protein
VFGHDVLSYLPGWKSDFRRRPGEYTEGDERTCAIGARGLG